MIHIPTWKQILILTICAFGALFALPNFMPQSMVDSLPDFMPKDKIVLGLDLQGGAHLLLEVEVNVVIKEQMALTADAVRGTLRKDRIGYTKLASRDGAVTFQLRNLEDQGNALKLLKGMDREGELDITADQQGLVTLRMTDAAIEARKARAVSQSIEIVRRRVDETGTAEPLIMQQGEDRILIQLPGLDDPTRIKSLLGKTAKLHFRMVDSKAVDGKARPGSEVLEEYGVEEGTTPPTYVVEKKLIVSGENLVSAQPGFDPESGKPIVNFQFDSLGSKRFGDATAANIGRDFAIVLDGKVISAPRITKYIPGSGYISGNFTVQTAQDLAVLMRSGALPAPLNILEERTVGPGLGADSIDAGQTATLIAIVIVALFMILAYYLFGILANIALAFNIILLLGIMTATGATLTLPGIAGIALTIGMAVDANVLIYERIKEELRNGKRIIAALDSGYNRAMATIIDSNLTTLIGGALLYYFGTGPIRGFAVTLSFGILISMFTAISVTRLVAVWYLNRFKPKVLPI
jgi:preprotein translocase subunit SecD